MKISPLPLMCLIFLFSCSNYPTAMKENPWWVAYHYDSSVTPELFKKGGEVHAVVQSSYEGIFDVHRYEADDPLKAPLAGPLYGIGELPRKIKEAQKANSSDCLGIMTFRPIPSEVDLTGVWSSPMLYLLLTVPKDCSNSGKVEPVGFYNATELYQKQRNAKKLEHPFDPKYTYFWHEALRYRYQPPSAITIYYKGEAVVRHFRGREGKPLWLSTRREIPEYVDQQVVWEPSSPDYTPR